MTAATLPGKISVETDSIKNILILNSYHPGYIWSDEIIYSFQDSLLKKYTNISFYTEFFDTKHFPKPSYELQIKALIQEKYKNMPIHVIVTTDNYALYFAQKHYDQLFLNIPVVFCGINVFNDEMVKKYPMFTGVLERYDLQGNINLIKKIHPNVKCIFFIAVSTFVDDSYHFPESEHPKVRIELLDGSKMTTPELIETIQAIKKDTVSIYLHWKGITSTVFYKSVNTALLVSENSRTPVYCMSSTGLQEHGLLGGKIITPHQQGNHTANIVSQILEGKSPKEIPVKDHVRTEYVFDYIQLKRFNISKSQLPPGSTIINETPNFYQRHITVIWGSVIIIGCLFGIILFLIININKRRQIEKTLNYEKNLLHSLMDNTPDFIYFKDLESRFIRNNTSHIKHLGAKTQEEVQGKSDFDFFDMKHASAAFADEQNIFKTGKPMINKIENALLKDNQHRWVSSTKVPVYNENGELHALIGISRDITKHKKIEDQIANSLAEKEILLKEIHHRVKNNLQIICSLLNLQTSTITDEYVRDLLKIAQNRVRSMALIHDNLYRRDDFTEIDMKKYISDLIPEISRSFNMQNHFVDIKISSQQANLIIDQAIPCGLIINELITNAIKHAFPEKEEKTYQIHVRFRVSGKNASLVIKDNGMGIPEDLNPFKTKSLGLKLVTMLAEEQLKGKVTFKRNKGTEFNISFPIRKK